MQSECRRLEMCCKKTTGHAKKDLEKFSVVRAFWKEGKIGEGNVREQWRGKGNENCEEKQ